MNTFTRHDRVVLLHSIPHHDAGEHGTVHDMHHHWIGVRFDTTPTLVRYVEPIDLSYAPPTSDEAVEWDLSHADRVAFNTIARSIANDDDTPCNYEHHDERCTNAAVWWFECRCGETMFGCEPHRAWFDQWNDTLRNRGKILRCAICHTERPNPLPWRAL